jgi:hypothetical protein
MSIGGVLFFIGIILGLLYLVFAATLRIRRLNRKLRVLEQELLELSKVKDSHGHTRFYEEPKSSPKNSDKQGQNKDALSESGQEECQQ